jgi:GrpB-like predicted nucleotidyltransferase (UPF0157 family)
LEETIIQDYSSAWAAAFDAERDRVVARLGPLLLAIQHIGSTSIVGLAAKPLIDMMVAVQPESISECVESLVSLDYERDESGDFDGRVFLRRLRADGIPTHHLSLTQLGGAYWRDQLAFRDALRADPALVSRYAELKRKLAADHGRSIDYTLAKTDFIRDALASVGHRPQSGWASEPS